VQIVNNEQILLEVVDGSTSSHSNVGKIKVKIGEQTRLEVVLGAVV
jgi:hypothetical protein